MTDHCFISYSNADALEFARKLADELQGGEDTFFKTWFDKRDIDPARDWDDQIVDGIRACKCMLFVMTKDSTAQGSMCKNEWNWALKYKKPVVPLRLHKDAEQPFGLGNRQWIDFTGDFEHGLSKLRLFLRELDSPKGVLQALKDRHADAERDLRRAKPEEQPRIQADIEELKKQIEVQQKVVDDPKAAEAQTQANIAAGLERERKPELPLAGIQSSKFINQPPGVAQNYFKDREMETEQVILFLKNDAQRLLTVVGRGGAGKTAMVCRLLKHIENSSLPDDFEKKHGKIGVDGIVYLSETGTRKVNFANLFEDLCKLLPAASAEKLSALYKEPQTSTESKTLQLLAAFQGLKQVIVLLDNFENVVDDEGRNVKDAELNDALRAFLHAPHHPIKITTTTRVTARELDEFEPARQRLLHLDTGLQPEYAKEAIRLMDEGNLVGIQKADEALLDRAVERTRGLPRALEAIYMALRNDRYTKLEELITLPILPEKIVEAYVGEAFNRLDTNAQKVMQALAVYNRPVTPAAVDYLLAPHIPAMDSAPILQRLANMHFARKESGRFYLHPVDREFAFGLIPEKDLTTETTESTEIFEEEEDVIKVEPDDVIPASDTNEESSEKSLKELEALLAQMEKEGFNYQSPITNYQFTQHDLTLQAADYFAAARRPRAEWKKLEDLSAQLAEFDLRCAAGDYDTAVIVLLEIDIDYLSRWGHYSFVISLHERLQDNIDDKKLSRISIENLGRALWYTGKIRQAISHYEKRLKSEKNAKDRVGESVCLVDLGNAYDDLGEIQKAIDFFEQALVIFRENHDRDGEGTDLGNLGILYGKIGETDRAINCEQSAIAIARETKNERGLNLYAENLSKLLIDKNLIEDAINIIQESVNKEILDVQIGSENNYTLALAYFYKGNLEQAKTLLEIAENYNFPLNNHNVIALHGIIALRQGEEVTARGAFVRAIGQADEILSKTAEYYSALDAKGLALVGAGLLRQKEESSGKDGLQDEAKVSTERPARTPEFEQAIECFCRARKIAPHAGVVKSMLRLFDELAKCDKEGVLKDVRSTAEGVE